MNFKFIAGVILLLGLASTMPLTAMERYDRSGKNTVAEISADNVTIVVESASPVTRFAAEELQTFLSQILGKTVPLAFAPGSNCNIYVGFGKFAAAQGVKAETLVRDGFYIRSFGKDILIAGTDDPKENIKNAINKGGAWSFHFERGSLFGVYDFLERFCGVRFYFPGELGTVVPKANSIKLPAINIADRPDMIERRYSSFWDGEYFEGENRKATINPNKNMNLLRLRSETSYLPCCHGMNGNNLLARFGKSNPEYFALTDNGIRRNDPDISFAGHICYSSKVTEEIYQDLKAYLTGQSPASRGIKNRYGKPSWTFTTFRKPYVDVMPQDGFYACQCDKCKAAYEDEKGREGKASKLVWGTVNGWAKRMKAEGVKGTLSMMAYWPYRMIPEEPIEDNILVMLAQRGPWQSQQKLFDADLELLKAWNKKLQNKVHIWNYANKVSTQNLPGIPAYTPLAVGRYYKAAAPYMFGAFMESECDRFLYFSMNYYIFCKVMWNSDVDCKAVMDEYYRLMFGNASAEMQKIMEEFEDIWLNRITGRVINTDIGPVASIPSDNEIWTKIYSKSKLDELDSRFASALKKVKVGSLEARRIELFQREFMQPLRKASDNYLAKSAAVNGLMMLTGKPVKLLPFDFKKGKKTITVDTAVTCEYTADALKITFDCEEPEMDNIVAVKRPNDDPDLWKDNSVEIFLNPAADKKVYYQIIVNSLGSLTDIRCEAVGKSNISNIKWNSNAKTVVKKTAKGFTIELSVPLTSLPDLKKTAFPINFGRSRVLAKQRDCQVLYSWSHFVSSFHDLENFGKLYDSSREKILDGSFDQLKLRDSKNTHWGYFKKGQYYGWIADRYKADGDKAFYDKDVFFSAPSSVRLECKSGRQFTFSQWFKVKFKPNTRYRISCMYKLQDVKPVKNGGGFCVNLWDDANRWFPKKNMPVGSCDWTNMTFEHTTSAKVDQSKHSYLRLRMMNCTGTVWVDNISIIELD